MARHKRLSGVTPMNTLSEHNGRKGSSTSYDQARYKRKREFMPDSFSIPDEDEEKEEVVTCDLISERECSPEQRDIKGTAAGSIKNIPGILGNVRQHTSRLESFHRAEGVLKIVSKDSDDWMFRLKTGLIVTFIKEQKFTRPDLQFQFSKLHDPIKGFSFTLNEGTLKFCYESNGKGFGIIFSHEMRFSVSKDKSIRTHCMSWICAKKSSESVHLLEAIDSYRDSLSRLNVLDISSDRISGVEERTIDEMVEEYRSSCIFRRDPRPPFSAQPRNVDRLTQKTLNSLQNISRRVKRGSESAQPILLPESNDSPKEGTDLNQAIPHNKFYGKSNGNIASDDGPAFSYVSNLKRITRSSSNTEPTNGMYNLSDDLFEQETPEIFEPTLSYTFSDDYKISVTNQDFKCLYNHDWVNDTILDFFMKYYIEEAIKNGSVLRQDVYLFSSFFYTKLVSSEEDRYLNVKKWVNNTDLFSKRYVVLPININFHWFGCIITNLEKVKKALESFTLNSSDGRQKLQADSTKLLDIPRYDKTIDSRENDTEEISIVDLPTVELLVFDSLRQTHSRLMDAVKVFIMDYAKDTYQFSVPRERIKVKSCLVPQQPNMSDCGVHVILNTRKFFEHPDETLMLWHTRSSHANSKQVNEFFEKKTRHTARKMLRGVLQQLQQKQIAEFGTNSTAHKQEQEEENHSDLEIIENYGQNVPEEEKNSSSDDRRLENIVTNIQTEHKEKNCHSPAECTQYNQTRAEPSSETSIYFSQKTPNKREQSKSTETQTNPPSTVPVLSQADLTDDNLMENIKWNGLSRNIVPSNLSDVDYRHQVDSSVEPVLTQPPPNSQSPVKRSTDELDNVYEEIADLEISPTRTPDVSVEENLRLSPIPNSVLNEKFRKLKSYNKEFVPSKRQKKIGFPLVDSRIVHGSNTSEKLKTDHSEETISLSSVKTESDFEQVSDIQDNYKQGEESVYFKHTEKVKVGTQEKTPGEGSFMIPNSDVSQVSSSPVRVIENSLQEGSPGSSSNLETRLTRRKNINHLFNNTNTKQTKSSRISKSNPFDCLTSR